MEKIKKVLKIMFSVSLFLLILGFTIMPVMAEETWPVINEITEEVLETTSDNKEGSGTTKDSLKPVDDSNYQHPNIPGRDSIIGGNSDSQQVYNAYIDVMPVVSTDDILRWATTKGNEIIYFLQIIVQPFTIIIFIIAAFMALIGSIGKGDMVSKGLWGMVCSALVYAGVLYAPVILQTFVGWVAF